MWLDHVAPARTYDATVRCYLNVISPFITRCRSMYYSCLSGDSWRYFLEQYATLAFPSLDHIYLDFGVDWINPGNAVEMSNSLKSSPLLKSPGLHSVYLPHCGPQTIHFPIRWNQLLVLHLYDATWDPRKAIPIPDALLLLSWCTRLEFCSIPLSDLSEGADHSGRTLTMISLPHMIGFSVRCDSDPKPFFLHLNTPSLRYFQHYQEIPPSPEAQMNDGDRALHLSLGPFLQRIIHPIEELQIFATYLTAKDVVRCLKLFRGLKRLSLLGYGCPLSFLPFTRHRVATLSISEWILETFIQRNWTENPNTTIERDEVSDDVGEQHLDDHLSPYICPDLEMLSIQGASFSDTTMLDLIHFRMLSDSPMRNGGSRLRWLTIYFPFGREGEHGTLKKLEDLRSCTDAHINVSHSTPFNPGSLVSPHNGLVSDATVSPDGVLTYTYLPNFGGMLASGT